jgi:hypothetical protein
MAHIYGEKKRCPNCGSNDVRKMSNREIQEFYGSNMLILSVPRKCRACGQEYEIKPSRGGCVVMMVVGVVGVVFGVLLSLLGLGILIFGLSKGANAGTFGGGITSLLRQTRLIAWSSDSCILTASSCTEAVPWN